MFYINLAGIDVRKFARRWASSMNVKNREKKMFLRMLLTFRYPEIWREIIAFLEFRDTVLVHHVLKAVHE